MGLHSKDRLLDETATFPLAYYATEIITMVKCFTIGAARLLRIKYRINLTKSLYCKQFDLVL
jgi:hypothetical protein